jgi:hypothetical protein
VEMDLLINHRKMKKQKESLLIIIVFNSQNIILLKLKLKVKAKKLSYIIIDIQVRLKIKKVLYTFNMVMVTIVVDLLTLLKVLQKMDMILWVWTKKVLAEVKVKEVFMTQKKLIFKKILSNILLF